jgi:hypothetical protein
LQQRHLTREKPGAMVLRSVLLPVRLPPARISRRVALIFGGAGTLVAITRESPTEHDLGELARRLGDAAGGVVVAPSEVRWEPARGVLEDLFFGRYVIFLASETPNAPRDVFRARVRLTPEGRPLAVAGVRNLTATSLGDDHALVIEGTRIAFATFAYGQEQSISILDLSGERAREPNSQGAMPFEDRAMAFLTNLQETGSGNGIGRVDVTLEQPARRVGLALSSDGSDVLNVTLEDAVGQRHATLDLAKNDFRVSAQGLRADVARHIPKRLSHWAVDTVRAVSWIGPAPIAWLEERVFALRDTAKQLVFKLRGEDNALIGNDTDPKGTADNVAAKNGASTPANLLDTSQTHVDDAQFAWPPPPMASIWKTTEPGEGQWHAPRVPFMRRLPVVDASAPSAFYEAFVRPDEQRAYAHVTLVAMDTRQLEIEMEAGSEDPKPLTGGHGPGHIPREASIATRVVATFNGAFKTEHGNYGMMVKKRVLLPPQPGAATIVTLADGRTGIGSWPQSSEVGGITGVDDGDIVAFRQNLNALVDLGRVNPSGRTQWGYTLPGTTMQTERSGVCVTAGGQIVYAWGDDVSATTLAKAMKMAGCAYGMHLDMNPHHTGFVFSAIDDVKSRRYKTQILSSEMEINPERYIEYAVKDFFYVLLRDPMPSSKSGVVWQVSQGAQPAPAWMPGLFGGRYDAPEGPVELLDVEPGRATFRVRAGLREPDAHTGAEPARELDADEAHRTLFAVGLGAASDRRLRGLATDGKQFLPESGGSADAPTARLVARRGEPVALNPVASSQLAHDDETLAAHDDVVELPLILNGDTVLPAALARGAIGPRSALGITREGRVVFARGSFASHAPLATTLARIGCMRAVALDRGAHATALLDRAETAAQPRARYDQTVLYAIATPMKPRAFRFEPRAPLAQAARGNATTTAKQNR